MLEHLMQSQVILWHIIKESIINLVSFREIESSDTGIITNVCGLNILDRVA
jgi:hypothetical protein